MILIHIDAKLLDPGRARTCFFKGGRTTSGTAGLVSLLGKRICKKCANIRTAAVSELLFSSNRYLMKCAKARFNTETALIEIN